MAFIKRLFPFIKPHRRRFALVGALSLLALFFAQMEPRLMGVAIDDGVAKGDLSTVALFCALLIGAAICFSVINYIRQVMQGTLGTDVVRELRDALYRKLQRLPYSYYTTMPTGQIMSRMLSDLDSVEQLVTFGLSTLLTEGLALLSTIVILFVLDAQLALTVMLPMPLILYGVVRFRKRIDPAWEDVREQMGKLTTTLQENVAGVRVVKAFAREDYASSRFDLQNRLNRSKNVHRARIEAEYFPWMDFVSGLIFIILILAGSLRLMEGTLSVGTFFMFNWYIWGLIWPVRILGWLTNLTRQAAAATPRVFQILDAEETVREAARPRVLATSGPARVDFEQVTFAFPDDPDRAVLKGLTFSVRPGETVAILGGTGSGKSSVINLVPRFFDVTGGSVKVDGVDVRELGLAALRRQIGIVPQESFLFSATLRDNIRFGAPEADDARVLAAAQVAQVDEFVPSLPKGYDTKVGERGVGLSGGQKQRVALSRAVLMDPRLLILDEATSAVDTATEQRIQHAMADVLRGRTAIVVAQRLSTIMSADRIIVLRDGRVAEEGTHAELYALDGEYRTLFDLQFRDQAHAETVDMDAVPVA
ncbi:MAG: ABC transporter ATP-binding protein/permease [Thermoflexales bacterium]|nr:ABC transporter ATP-binding protein/permease [Thermoflexales bacterium]